jgi:PIN domain nuclease of toxin-antitoxin system
LTRVLLDTCACLWIAESAPLSNAAVAALDEAFDDGQAVFVSPFTAWEVGMLAARGRLALTMTPLRWFDRLIATPGASLAPLPASVLIAASFLPGNPGKDLADRIMIATAREESLTIVTRDSVILAYADEGQVLALAC